MTDFPLLSLCFPFAYTVKLASQIKLNSYEPDRF